MTDINNNDKTDAKNAKPDYFNDIMNAANNAKVVHQHYSVAVKENDYIRCIHNGGIKVHHLAALSCDLSPIEDRENQPVLGNFYIDKATVYKDDLFDSRVQMRSA
jgi:hypothetical protein